MQARKLRGVCDVKVKADQMDVARASRPLWRGHPFAALRAGSARALRDFAFTFDRPYSHDVKGSLVRERDAPAKAGETPALHRFDRLSLSCRASRPVFVLVLAFLAG